jgi:hypothetical protein
MQLPDDSIERILSSQGGLDLGDPRVTLDEPLQVP